MDETKNKSGENSSDTSVVDKAESVKAGANALASTGEKTKGDKENIRRGFMTVAENSPLKAIAEEIKKVPFSKTLQKKAVDQSLGAKKRQEKTPAGKFSGNIGNKVKKSGGDAGGGMKPKFGGGAPGGAKNTNTKMGGTNGATNKPGGATPGNAKGKMPGTKDVAQGGEDKPKKIGMVIILFWIFFTLSIDIFCAICDFFGIGLVFCPFLQSSVCLIFGHFVFGQKAPGAGKILSKFLVNMLPVLPTTLGLFCVDLYMHNHPKLAKLADKATGKPGAGK